MARLWRRRLRRVLMDVDTQLDLLIPQADHVDAQLLRNIRRLMAWGRLNHYPVISTVLSCRPGESAKDPKAHQLCVEGTRGQEKIGYSMLANPVRFKPDRYTDLPANLLKNHQQIIFEKRTVDIFNQPRADRLLTDLAADEFIVFGSELESAIQLTVLGLLSRRKKVTLVLDAISIDGVCVNHYANFVSRKTNPRNPFFDSTKNPDHGSNIGNNGVDNGNGNNGFPTNLADRKKLIRSARLTLRKLEAKGAKIKTTEMIAGKSRLTGGVLGQHHQLAAHST
ncbi:MAG: isochorismatase family protein [Planctomycetes bacterium]|nr:isochorismatase family protein [Planctomycetota bacterium]